MPTARGLIADALIGMFMTSLEYCTIVDVCEFLAKHRMAQFTSYGITKEFVTNDQGGFVEPVPAIKPHTLFRGQNRAYESLRPTIYRPYPLCVTWQREQTARIGDDTLRMPNPYYSEDLEREFYFSCIKAAEVIARAKVLFPDFPDEVDGHALCQHYGLPTHMLDFTQDVWIAGFFASHRLENNRFAPCTAGTGVMYVLEVEAVPEGAIFEIGIQPLPRPFAQRGFLLRVPPTENLIFRNAVTQVYFQHSPEASAVLAERFANGSDLVPVDDISENIESALRERSVTQGAIDYYIDKVPPDHRDTLRASIHKLFGGQIQIV